jgi:hypothetical protein
MNNTVEENTVEENSVIETLLRQEKKLKKELTYLEQQFAEQQNRIQHTVTQMREITVSIKILRNAASDKIPKETPATVSIPVPPLKLATPPTQSLKPDTVETAQLTIPLTMPLTMPLTSEVVSLPPLYKRDYQKVLTSVYSKTSFKRYMTAQDMSDISKYSVEGCAELIHSIAYGATKLDPGYELGRNQNGVLGIRKIKPQKITHLGEKWLKVCIADCKARGLQPGVRERLVFIFHAVKNSNPELISTNANAAYSALSGLAHRIINNLGGVYEDTILTRASDKTYWIELM